MRGIGDVVECGLYCAGDVGHDIVSIPGILDGLGACIGVVDEW